MMFTLLKLLISTAIIMAALPENSAAFNSIIRNSAVNNRINSSTGTTRTTTTRVSGSIAGDSDITTSYADHQKEGFNIGFIGFGTIASSIATGLLTQTEVPISSIFVSRRSESKSRALMETFGSTTTATASSTASSTTTTTATNTTAVTARRNTTIIQISDDNQFIADQSDLIFLCVLPQQEEEVLGQLKLSQDKTLVSLVVRTRV